MTLDIKRKLLDYFKAHNDSSQAAKALTDKLESELHYADWVGEDFGENFINAEDAVVDILNDRPGSRFERFDDKAVSFLREYNCNADAEKRIHINALCYVPV